MQDDQAGILIDDLNVVITTNYQVGDEIGNVVGTLTEFGACCSSFPRRILDRRWHGKSHPAILITIVQFINSFDTYESRL